MKSNYYIDWFSDTLEVKGKYQKCYDYRYYPAEVTIVRKFKKDAVCVKLKLYEEEYLLRNKLGWNLSKEACFQRWNLL